MHADERREEPGVRDEADEEKADEQPDANGEYGVSSIEYGEEEAGPGERGEVGAGVVDQERTGGALPSAGRSAQQEDGVHEAETKEKKGRRQDDREQKAPGRHEGFSERRIGSDILVDHLDDGLS